MVILMRHAVRLVRRAGGEGAAGGRQEWGMETRCLVGTGFWLHKTTKATEMDGGWTTT